MDRHSKAIAKATGCKSKAKNLDFKAKGFGGLKAKAKAKA